MRNIKLTIEYNGTNYNGWQKQTNKLQVTSYKSQVKPIKTIQQTIEKALKKILQEKVKLIASGRTDSGVHAKAQAANFKSHSKLKTTNIHKALNSLLPADIRITNVKQMPLDFHARFDVKSKIYRYTILNRKVHSVFNYDFVSLMPYDLDIGLMKKEAKCLLGKHNFKSFQASDKDRKTSSVRTIKSLTIRKRGSYIYIDIEADGFLFNMVRNIVGTLVDIGRGKFPEGSMGKILKAKNRKFAGQTAPAKGLCLMKVFY